MTLLVKIISAAKEIAVAQQFGTGYTLDAFLFAYLIPAFAINVLAGSFSASMMPTYIRTRENISTEAANELLSSLLLIGFLFLTLAALILAATAPTLLPVLASGFDIKAMELTEHLFYWLLPITVLAGTGHLLSTAINSEERFALVAITPAITPLVTVIAMLYAAEDWGAHSLVAGALFGTVIEMIVLIAAAARQGIPVLPRWSGMTKELRTVIDQYTPMVAGAFLMSSTQLVDQSMAAMLEPGSVSSLNYGNKVVAVTLGIGSMAIGTAILPQFSHLVANEDWRNLRHTLKTYGRLIILLVTPLTGILFIFSQPIIETLFERGAFTHTSTILVSQVQAYYSLQLPFYLLGILAVRTISALAKNDILMKLAGLSLALNIIGNYTLIPHFGIAGIALSTTIVYATSTFLTFSFLYITLKRQISSTRHIIK
jgi:putative peptidoglycan lipid II flippase